MKFNFFTIVLKTIMLGSVLIIGCSKGDDIKDKDPISSRFGEFVEIPDFDENTTGSTELLATDQGLYITLANTNDVDDWIYRYDLDQEDILNGSWEKVQYKPTSELDFISTKTPLNWKMESVSQHEIFITPKFYAFKMPVFKTLNMSNGNTIKQENAPIHNFSYAHQGTYESYGKILKGAYGDDWAVFQGQTVSDDNLHVIKIRYGNLPFNNVCSITAEGELFYTLSLTTSNLYALSYQEQKLFIINSNGQIITKDLSTYYDSDLSLYDFKNKFRFSNTGVYFQFQDKVLKLVGDDNISLFYTIQYEGNFVELGDFCVDNDYLFATDGTRKELTGFYKEVNIIPDPPTTSNQEIFLDYIEKTTHFKIGELETSTNPNDKYIYVLGANGKILVISKHYI
jgi:hypothetical protein